MDRKKIVVMLLCCFIVSIVMFSKIFTGPGVADSSLGPFNELIKIPDEYRILDFDKWEDGMSRTSLYSVQNSEICVTEEDTSSVAKITDMLNQKKFTPITRDEFDLNYNESNNKVKFWISTSADPELAKDNFYSYNIFICEDMSLYVEAIKSSDYRYLKDVIKDDEYKFIEQTYNTLLNKKRSS